MRVVIERERLEGKADEDGLRGPKYRFDVGVDIRTVSPSKVSGKYSDGCLES